MNGSELLRDLLAEVVHTAFRKGCNNGTPVHQAMSSMKAPDWADAIEWMAYYLEDAGVVFRDEAFDSLRKRLAENRKRAADYSLVTKVPQMAWHAKGQIHVYDLILSKLSQEEEEEEEDHTS